MAIKLSIRAGLADGVWSMEDKQIECGGEIAVQVFVRTRGKLKGMWGDLLITAYDSQTQSVRGRIQREQATRPNHSMGHDFNLFYIPEYIISN